MKEQVKIDISAEDRDGWVLRVEVTDDNQSTLHSVSLTRDTYGRLAGEEEMPEDLLYRVFQFLLARESRDSIMRSFDVEDVNHYFPEFETEIVK